MQKRNENQQAVEDSKSDIGWGSQIRSTFSTSPASRICAPGETGNTQAVLGRRARPVH